jgi:hypothetical protein
MASAVNTGSINMPKMLRHLSHRTNQVRDLVFIREPIYRKDIKTTGQTSATKGTSTALAGPAVNFGYETNSFATQSASADTAYHINSPRMSFPGLKALQSPITSRSGQHERSGHRITGECKFYLPSLSTIKNMENFGEATLFNEFETNDRFIDVERIIHNPDDISATAQSHTITFADKTAGFEVDRIQFKITPATSATFSSVTLRVNDAGTAKMIRYEGDVATLAAGRTYIFDYPFRKVVNNVPYSQWIDGVEYSVDSDVYLDGTTTVTTIETDKLYGDSNNELTSLNFYFGASEEVVISDIYLYKEAEWRVDSVKDYRDEYMEVRAVRVRGDRTSRRRAYG